MPEPTTSEARLSPERSWSRVHLQTFVIDGGQTATIRIVAQFEVFSYRIDMLSKPTRYIRVSLKGSTVNPGPMRWNEQDRRGWFTGLVKVQISSGDGNVVLVDASPETTDLVGSTSVTSSIDLSGNLGGFGGTGTGGVSIGSSNSTSWTSNLSGFTIHKTMGPFYLDHEYRMSATKDGGAYDPGDPDTLCDMTTAGAFAKVFSGKPPGTVYKPPDRAVSDLDILSQALFVAPEDYTATTTFAIIVQSQVHSIEKTFYLLVTKPVFSMKQIETATLFEDIDLGMVS